MPKSKNIQDYFPAKLSDLRKNEMVPFSVHLYFRNNQHVMTWIHRLSSVEESLHLKYLDKSLSTIWIHKDDRHLYEKYMAGILSAEDPAKSAEGIFIAEVLNDEVLSDPEKEALVSETAQDVLREASRANTPAEDQAAKEKIAQVVSDVFRFSNAETHPITTEILGTMADDAELKHAFQVSVFSVLMALAFGKIDMKLLSDIALAGLLHDIGHCMLPSSVLRKPYTLLESTDRERHHAHVHEAIKWVSNPEYEIPSRVVELVSQHHERFNGTGYPRGYREYDFDDIAQLIAIAELLEALKSGQFDSNKRNSTKAISTLRQMQHQDASKPEFNPEIFRRLEEWFDSDGFEDSKENARTMVQHQLKSVVQIKESS